MEKRFFAVLGEVRLHCWYCIVMRHVGHVYRDVFCSLFTWFAAKFFSSYCSPSLFVVSFDPICWAPWDFHLRAFIALVPLRERY